PVEQGSAPQDSTTNEPVWTYRGYRLKGSEFTTAMVHLYRGEVQRANVWRQRLDNTTNWAVITAGAAISFALGNASGHHGVIILNMLLITLFLFIEARRYRYYELFASRVRLMETDFFAAMFVPPFGPAADWAESMAENLLHPHFTISTWEAVGRRFRRNYLWIYVVLAMAWVAKSALFPTTLTSWPEFVQRSAIGAIPGDIVIIAGIVFLIAIFAVGLGTVGLQHATGEVLPRYADSTVMHTLSAIFAAEGAKAQDGSQRAWYRGSGKRAQLVALIIGGQKSEQLSQSILSELHRGATRLEGTGAYTGQPHPVLVIALTVTEVNHLKALVSEIDPTAFVIVMPAQEILGRGFQPLHTETAK
ncbi:MAG TPA: DUF2270 domain-containing protein, partial [Anaerolineae bacterium]|nr:DUF2270 domain-containing protein [Anaerolineae bacterium]